MGRISEYSEDEQKFLGVEQLPKEEINLFYDNFSTRTKNVLIALNISTFEELKRLTVYDLLNTRNAGPTTAREIVDFFWKNLG